MADNDKYVSNIQGAIQAYKDAGKPPESLNDLRDTIQENYDKLAATGYFKGGDGQQLQGVLKQSWGVKDTPLPAAPASSPAVPPSSPVQPAPAPVNTSAPAPAQTPIVSPAYDGTLAPARYIDPGAKDGDPLGHAMLAIDQTAHAYQAAPNFQTEQAHRQAVGNAVKVLQDSGAASRHPEYQQFIADAQKQGWDYSNAAFTSHGAGTPAASAEATPAPAEQNPVAQFFKSIPGDIADDAKGLARLPGMALNGLSLLRDIQVAGLQHQMGNNSAAANTIVKSVPKADQFGQAAAGAIPGTAKDIAAGRAADIPGNYLTELKHHPFNFVLNAAAVATVGAGGLLARAGAMERGAAAAARAGDAAQAASLAAKAARLRTVGTAVDDAASGKSLVRGAVRGAGKLRRPVAVPAKPITTPAALPATMPVEAPASPVQSAQPIEQPHAPIEQPHAAPAPTPQPKAAHTGNVNTGRMAIGDDAKEAIAEHMRSLLVANPDHLAPRSNADTLAAAKALKLTPEMLEPFAHDEVPQGVPAGVYRTAVRDLTGKAATAEAAAADAYKAAPTPENEDALRQANKAASDLTARASALSLEAGRGVQSGNISVDGLEAALHDAAGKAADLSQVPRLADPPPSFTTQAKPPRPRSAGYGAKNKIVTTEAYQQALKDLGSLGTRVNSGIDPALFKPAVTIGAYHIEAGARQFGAWAGQMKTHFPQASDTDLQRVYAAARAQVVAGTQKAASAAQRTAYAPVLADSLAPRMGKQGVSDFMNALPDTVLDKWIHGDKMTEAERRVLAETHDAHLLPDKPKPPVNETLKTLRRAVGDAKAGRLGYASAKAAVQGELRKLLAAGKKSKLQDLPPADRKVELDKLAPAARKSEMQKLAAYDKQGDIAVGLAKLPDGDFHALANYFNRNAPAGFVINHKHLLQASLLSGPKTLGGIAAAHAGSALFEDGPVRGAANLVDPLIGKISSIHGPNTIQPVDLKASGRAIKAGLSATKDAGVIMKDGPTSLQLRGYDKGRTFEQGLHHEFTAQSKYKALDAIATHGINPLVRYAGRTHAALYHVIGEAMEARGLEEGAYLKARRQGGKAGDYKNDEDVQEFAREYRKEQMFQNGNQAASALRFHGKSPILKGISNTLTPFATVPLNLIGRGVELTGAGVPIAGIRALQARKNYDYFSKDAIVPKSASPAQAEALMQAHRRSLSLQAGRGLAGATVLGGTGAILRAKGILNSPDQKAHEGPSLNIGANKYDIGRFQPLSTAIVAGSMAYDAAHGHADNPAGLFTDNPYLSASEQVQNITSSFDGNPNKAKEWIRAVGGFVGPLSPTMLAQIAAATDPSGETRKKEAAWDYIFNRVPGLREKLQTSGNVQPSNIKSTGLGSLLYPANVTPRGAVPAKRGGGTRKAPSGLGGSGYRGLGKMKL